MQVLCIALTDTFGTPTFLKAFTKPIPTSTATSTGAATTSASAATGPGRESSDHVSFTKPPLQYATNGDQQDPATIPQRYADVFTGTRQDSGDPLEFIKTMRKFYDEQGIKTRKTIVFSDSLNVDRCIEYKDAAEAAGFTPTFGVGTFFTSRRRPYQYIVAYTNDHTDDFTKASTGEKSKPLNIVIKLSSAGGKPAIKISDNLGKNTGDSATVAEVKQQLGYTEHEWAGGDERTRLGA